MPLHQKIDDDLKSALKSRDVFTVGVLRMLSASLHNRSIEKKGKGQDAELTDDEVQEVLGREAKKRKEAAEIYEKGGRPDLGSKEKQEFILIKAYLPEEMGSEEIEKVVEGVLAQMGSVTQKEFGKVMGEVMKQLKGRADASTVSAILKKKLG